MNDFSGSGLAINVSLNACSDEDEFPVVTKTFVPFLLLEFLVAAGSNVVLMTLVIKARKVQNNTNIYLFSLSLAGLIASLILFMLLVTVIAGKWVLGRAFCVINRFSISILLSSFLLIHLAISRDRYKAVRDPFNWHPRTSKTLVITSVIWGSSLVFAIFRLSLFYSRQLSLPTAKSCFGIGDNNCSNETITIPLVQFLPQLCIMGAIYLVVLVVTLTYYMLIIKDLRQVEQLRMQYKMLAESPVLKVNGKDKPVQCTAEERAAKSLAILFLIQFICAVIIYIYNAVSVIRAVVASQGTVVTLTKSHPAEDILLLSVGLLPSANPAVLIVTNKRFRNRVKEFFHRELKPETAESGSSTSNQKSIKLQNYRVQIRKGSAGIFIQSDAYGRNTTSLALLEDKSPDKQVKEVRGSLEPCLTGATVETDNLPPATMVW